MGRCLKCGRRWSGEHPDCPPTPPATEESAAGQYPPEPVIPGFEIVKPLGLGGFGAVYLGKNAEGRKAAIKVARADNLIAGKMLKLEIDVLKSMAPPAVPEVIAEGELEDGVPWAALELIPWPTLSDWLAEYETPPSPHTVAPLVASLVEGVARLHSLGYVHRDLKPDNVFVDPAGTGVRLIDFGAVAKIGYIDEEGIGSVEYMAPEQLKEGSTLGAYTDVYAVGALAYEMLTLRPPFFGEPATIRAAHLQRRPPRLTRYVGLPQKLEVAVLRCLAKEPSSRYSDITEFGRDFTDGAAEASEVSVPVAQSPATEGDDKKKKKKEKSKDAKAKGVAAPILVFSSEAEEERILAELRRIPADLAQREGANHIAVVDPDNADEPMTRAVEGARRLLGVNLCGRVLVDMARVRVRVGRSGKRFRSPQFKEALARLKDSLPPGVLLSQAARSLAPDLPGDDLGDQDLTHVRSSIDHALDETSIGTSEEPLVGRDDELKQIVTVARQSLQQGGKPALFTVIGDAGVGKSRLASGLMHIVRSAMPDVELVSFRARESSAGASSATLEAILHRLLHVPATPPKKQERVKEKLEPEVGEAWPTVALALGWMTADAPELEQIRRVPGAIRSQTMQATGELLRREGRRKPQLILIDDAHLADPTTLDALEYATLAESDAPIMVCVFARPLLLESRQMWGDRAGVHQQLELGPLPEDAAADLCRELLHPAENVPKAAVETIVSRSQGNPMLLAELIRSLKREGILREQSPGVWMLETDRLEALPEMPRMEWLAQRELAQLPPDLAGHAKLAAALGREFTIEDMEGVLDELEDSGVADQFPLDARAGVEQLDQAGILRLRSGEKVQFRHALMRDSIAEGLKDEFGADLHRAAYRYYDSVDESDPQRLSRLAYHAALAGMHSEAAQHFAELAEETWARHQYFEAEGLFSKVLNHEESSPGKLVARRGRGQVRYRIGRYADALEDLQVARGLSQELGDRDSEVDVVLDEATALDFMARFRKSQELLGEAEDLAGSEPAAGVLARLLMGQGRSEWRFGRVREAAERLDEAVKVAETAGDDAYESLVASMLMLGFLRAQFGELDRAEEIFDRTLALTRERGDRLHELAALNNRHTLWIAHGRPDRAIEDLRIHQQLGREIGATLSEFYGAYNLSELLYYDEQLEEAWELIERAVEISMRRPDIMPRPAAHLLKGRMLLYRGQTEELAELCAEIRALHDKAVEEEREDGQLLEGELVVLGALELGARGEGGPEAWKPITDVLDKEFHDQMKIEMVELNAIVAERAGDRGRARELLEQALQIAGEMPNTIEPRVKHKLEALA